MKETIVTLVAFITTALTPTPAPLLSPVPKILPEMQKQVLAEHQLDLTTRHENPFTNDVFVYNILLALDYFDYSLTLEPDEVFAFHEKVAPEFAEFPLKTGWTKYTASEGYKTVGGLPGNGVCHLASLMNWVAHDAGLEVVAKVNHNFVPVPGVPKEYGTSIRYFPNGGNSQNQNLYIINSFDFPVKFDFSADNEEVRLKITK